jgi:5-methylcytosine-specific restriction endonuclease McrBC regulatory subunit McrC
MRSSITVHVSGMGPGEIIEFLTKCKLLDRQEILEMSVKELYLMLEYLRGVRPKGHRAIG